MLAGQSRDSIGRLNADGSLDLSFNPGTDGSIYCFAVQPDGKMVVGGWFRMLGGQSRKAIGRLNADGSLDLGFNPGADDDVCCLMVQADGKILVGGFFTTLGGESRKYIGRLNADGTLDTGFDPGADDAVHSLTLQVDGKILVGGYFKTLGKEYRMHIGRLNADGTLDANFNPGADGYVGSLAVQADGKVLVGGYFHTLGGQSRYCLGRLAAAVPAVEILSVNGSTVTWLRGGSGPEVWRAALETAGEGMAWIPHGEGTRVPGGWQWTGMTLPTNATLRARGFTMSGRYNGSGGVIETSSGAPYVTTQPASQTVVVDGNGFFTLKTAGSEPFAYQWLKNGIPIPGATDWGYILTNVQTGDAGLYGVIVSNAFGTVTSSNATLSVVWVSVPDSFNPAPDGIVNALAVQADGKVVVGGEFSVVGGQDRRFIARVNRNGSLDPGFNPCANNEVNALALQEDGKVLVGGSFTALGGEPRNNIGRLNADGSLDVDFNPGADDRVYSLAVQPDGRILVGGDFSTLGGQLRNAIGRLNADGSLDVDFNPGASGRVYSMVVQPDKKIFVGGDFYMLGGELRNNIGRLHADGSLDPGFDPDANYEIYSIALQADGKILLAGAFWKLCGGYHDLIGRVNADGSLDQGFNANAEDREILSLAVQTDGKILIGGGFESVNRVERERLGRLNADGSLDTFFGPTAGNEVYSLAVQADGKVLVGGDFITLGGEDRDHLGRLTATEPAVQKLTWNNSTVTWQRTGTGPEVSRTVLDVTTDGTKWIRFGDGTRVVGGWQWTGVVFPTNGTLRARGFMSAGIVETVIGPPAIIGQPISQARTAGTNAWFSVTAVGSEPLAYQWLKTGTNLPGATTATLSFSDVNRRQAGIYSVWVSNPFGALLSSNAVLEVRSPQHLGVAHLAEDDSFTLTSADSDGTALVDADLLGFEAYASTNLIDWLPLTNALSITNGALLLRDTGRSNHPARYYRLMEH
jgi:uncharacterized delta-60 repeat protein